MEERELKELYLQEFPPEMTWNEASDKLDTMVDWPDFQELCRMYCDTLVTVLTGNYIKYDFDVTKMEICQIFFHNVERLDKNQFFYWAFYYFLKKDYSKCKTIIQDLFARWENDGCILTEEVFVLYFALPYKNAFDGFWTFVGDELKQVKAEEGMDEFCRLVGQYYASDNREQALECLQSFMQKYPEYKLPIEWSGYTYYTMSMWNNAIACFERIDEPLFFWKDEIDWMLAWSFGKVKDYVAEERYYRKCQETNPEREYLLNNLGYSLYKQKKYSESKNIFEECLRKNIDMPYAANNYVRALMAMGRNGDAKRFVKDGKYRVSKALKDKVLKLDDSDVSLKEDTSVVTETGEERDTAQSAVAAGVRHQQFSNEKLLEDELTARIESGVPVFGLNLKIYRRHGEYGRQYIIPVGRLDLFCEDSEGNLYVIELKKDSGYDDVYQQLADYLTWFEQSDKFKGKKVYGIICLNHSSEELVEKVHADERMKLYEYQISYVQK